MEGMRPKGIAPLIFNSSKKKECLVSKSMDNEFWISQINTHGGLTTEHIVQFTKLWEMTQDVQIDNDTVISWNFSGLILKKN
jgi:hypothetical protein